MIVHLANSTLSGAPAMLAAAQRRCGKAAVLVQFGDNNLDRLSVSPEPLAYTAAADWLVLLRMLLRAAKVVHVHNRLPISVEEILVEELNHTDALRVWHLHQGRYERPIYLPTGTDIRFDKLAVVAHAFARTLPDFIPMPNCVFRDSVQCLPPEVFRGVKDGDKIKVMFSPSTKGGARWSRKFDPKFQESLEGLRTDDRFHIHIAEGEHSGSLLYRRHAFDVTIDEVVTGGYHLVSYEGLAAGCAVINGADWLSLALFRAAFQVERDPPFVYAEPETVGNVVRNLANDKGQLRVLQEAGREYFNQYMRPERIVSIYDEFYGLA